MQIMTEKKIVPKLRFGEFKDSWKEKTIGKLFEIKAGGDISKDRLSKHKTNHFKYPVFSNSLKNKGLFGYTDLFRFEGNCITVTGRGSLGIANARFESFYPIVRLLVLKPKQYFDIYFGENTINRINFFIESTGVPQLTAPQISPYRIVFPSLSEQQKIASFLSAVDEKLQQLTKKKDLLEEYKKGVMQKIFSQEIRFKDDNGNNYPDWKEKSLGEIGETFNGLTGKTKEDFGRGRPFIQYMQIFNSARIDTSKFGYVDINEGEKQKTAKYGDVFFTTSSETPLEIGYASVLTEEIEEVYLNSFCFGYRPNSLTELYPYFASYLFRSESLRKQIVKLAQGSTRYNMSKVQLMKVLIKLPLLDEQQKIANLLSSLDSKIDLVSTQIENTKAFKKGLLQQMFV